MRMNRSLPAPSRGGERSLQVSLDGHAGQGEAARRPGLDRENGSQWRQGVYLRGPLVELRQKEMQLGGRLEPFRLGFLRIREDTALLGDILQQAKSGCGWARSPSTTRTPRS